MRELGDDARPVVHLLLQGEVPQVPVLLVYLMNRSCEVNESNSRVLFERCMSEQSHEIGENDAITAMRRQ